LRRIDDLEHLMTNAQSGGDQGAQSGGDQGAQSGGDQGARIGASVALAERLGVGRYDLRVVEVIDFGRAMRRVVLAAPALVDLAPRPGQDLMLSVATGDGRFVRRRYTVRHHDPVAASVAIDMVLHGDGPGARWAAAARAGDEIEAIGPRGVVTIDADAAWHLFIGDESYFPAMSAMVESLPAEMPAWVICEADVPAELPPILATPAPASQLLARVDDPADPRRLLEALTALSFPEGSGRAYVGGEFHVVAALKEALRTRGFDDAHVSAKAYWRAGSANAGHGEPER
jgi:NADPH-dependent ferric siderophore reductase